MARPQSRAEIIEEIGRLASLSRADLSRRWAAIFGCAPPNGIKRGLLERACAYDLQTKAFGGLSRSARQSLLAIAEGKPFRAQSHSQTLRPGSRLVREWHGTVHQVDVSDGCLTWNGRNYRSLSAVAKAITGTAWSGRRFFGLGAAT